MNATTPLQKGCLLIKDRYIGAIVIELAKSPGACTVNNVCAWSNVLFPHSEFSIVSIESRWALQMLIYSLTRAEQERLPFSLPPNLLLVAAGCTYNLPNLHILCQPSSTQTSSIQQHPRGSPSWAMLINIALSSFDDSWRHWNLLDFRRRPNQCKACALKNGALSTQKDRLYRYRVFGGDKEEETFSSLVWSFFGTWCFQVLGHVQHKSSCSWKPIVFIKGYSSSSSLAFALARRKEQPGNMWSSWPGWLKSKTCDPTTKLSSSPITKALFNSPLSLAIYSWFSSTVSLSLIPSEKQHHHLIICLY